MLDGEATAAAASSVSQEVAGAPLELHQPRSLAQVRPLSAREPPASRRWTSPSVSLDTQHLRRFSEGEKKKKKAGTGNDEMFPETEIIDT